MITLSQPLRRCYQIGFATFTKSLLVPCLILLLSSSSGAQQLNKRISFTNNFYEEGDQIIELKDGYVILGTKWDNRGEPRSSAVLRVNEQGDTLWTTVVEMSLDSSIYSQYPTMLLHRDTIYFIVRYFRFRLPDVVVRIYRMELSGRIIDYEDIRFPETNYVTLTGFVGNKDGLYICGVGSLHNKHLPFVYHLSYELEVLDKQWLDINARDEAKILSHSNGGIILIFPALSSKDELVFVRMDKNLNPLRTWRSAHKGGGRNRLRGVVETKDGGYIFAWPKLYKDNETISYSYKAPNAVIKTDSLGNLEWKHIFSYPLVKDRYKIIKHLSATNNGNILVSGYDVFIRMDKGSKSNRHSHVGWMTLLSPQGKIIWEHSVIDTAGVYNGSIYYGTETKDGFAFVGSVLFRVSMSNPLLVDGDIWMLTLDTNGCWNTNCDSFIVIVGDKRSITWKEWTKVKSILSSEKGHTIKLFPNPVASLLNVRILNDPPIHRHCNVRVIDQKGQYQLMQDIQDRITQIDLSSLSTGVYYVLYSENGKLTDAQKIMIHR